MVDPPPVPVPQEQHFGGAVHLGPQQKECPPAPVWGYKGIASRRGSERGRGEQASKMEAAHLFVLLTFLLGSLRAGQGLEEGLGSKELFAEEPNGYPERLLDWMQQENEEHVIQSSPEEHPMGGLLRSLLHAVQRPGRSPSFLFQPQRFGRDARSSPSDGGRINLRARDSMAPQFLSMATPQRFGKKK
ncbi:LOW QUALITY PROTEIN: pro-FMRFamide-related neuropeptide FF [Eublepharis macularius]|uniref:LOW QUALITY PROTEIN: pro-FMRFamide-related neuropeptide FF n=1 Tax=Eublepharis macularius TaxID=481883 RepID=A0AA97KPE8_EUBMA|nr:LOW QUALITY PROTEIN: pro-FMRFamide-related neuropeptide FF [Eublepharis macularius]